MLKKTGFNINKIMGSGTLILPISMSRIAGGQAPEDCYEMLGYFEDKFETFNNDAILMYTNGLYFNSEEVAYEKRIKTNNQVLNHISSMRKLIDKNRKFMPKAVHFLSWDYIIFNSVDYENMFGKLKQLSQSDEEFIKILKEDLEYQKREFSVANINFILEEVVVGHLIREKLVDLPVTLAKDDDWRLICYPGSTIKSEVYVYQKNILEKNKKVSNEFSGSMYNFKDKVLEVFSDIVLN